MVRTWSKTTPLDLSPKVELSNNGPKMVQKYPLGASSVQGSNGKCPPAPSFVQQCFKSTPWTFSAGPPVFKSTPCDSLAELKNVQKYPLDMMW